MKILQLAAYKRHREAAGKAVGGAHMFLLAGQSNVVSRAVWDNGADYPSDVFQLSRLASTINPGPVSSNADRVIVPAFRPLDHRNQPTVGGFAWDLDFVRLYRDANPNATIVLIPCGAGNSGFELNGWNKGNSLYNDAVSRCNEVLANNPSWQFKGILWKQAGGDRSNIAAYQARLDQFIADIRADITGANATTPFVTGGQPQTSLAMTGSQDGRDELDRIVADTPNRVAYSAYVRTDGATTVSDNLHHDAPGMRFLGEKYYEAYLWARTNTQVETPDVFDFTDLTDQETETVVTSEQVLVTGISTSVPISIVGGEYRILANLGFGNATPGVETHPWGSAPDMMVPGRRVQVRLTTSAAADTAATLTLTVGGREVTWTATTEALSVDTTPDAFSFTDATDVALSTVTESDDITVSGINAPAAISVTGGEYRINGGSWVSSSGTVSNGDTVRVRGTSSGSNSTAVNVVLTIGGVSDTFTIITEAAAGGALDPATMFLSGEEGFYFAPSASTAWEDQAGTVPATVGGIVSRLTDLSGNANDATQSDVAAAPSLTTDGVSFSTTGLRHLIVANGISSSNFTFWMKYDSATVPNDVMAMSAPSSIPNWFFAASFSSTNVAINSTLISGALKFFADGVEVFGTNRGQLHALVSSASTFAIQVIGGDASNISNLRRIGVWVNDIYTLPAIKQIGLIDRVLSPQEHAGLAASDGAAPADWDVVGGVESITINDSPVIAFTETVTGGVNSITIEE